MNRNPDQLRRTLSVRIPNVAQLLTIALMPFAAVPMLAQTSTEPAATPAPVATATPSDSQMEQGASEEHDKIVTLDAFQVSTSIGAYHEETSSMATKVPTDLKDLSSSLQILNANAISDKNANTLQDVFAYVVGLSQSQQNVNGFTFRGFSNSGSFTQNIEYDGLQGGALKKGAQSAANVEDIEFLKGPNSVLYGQMRPGGLLNIVTKSPQEVQSTSVKWTMSTYAGRYNDPGSVNGTTGVIDTTGPIDKGGHWLYRLIIDGESTPSYRLADYDKLLSVFPSLSYVWNKDTSLTIKLEADQDRRRTDDGLVPIFTNGTAFGKFATWQLPNYNVVYQDPTDLSRDRGETASLLFTTKIGMWTARVQERSVWHTDSAREFTNNNASVFSPKAAFATPATVGLTRQYNNVINGHRYHYYDANIYGTLGPKAFSNTLIFGVGGGQEFFNNIRYGFGPNVLPVVSIYNPVLGQTPYPADGTALQASLEQFVSFGAYGMDQIQIGDRIHLTLGTRYNQQEAHGIDVYNPVKSPYVHNFVTKETSSAGINFSLTKDVSLYANWAQSFLPNDVTSIDQTGASGFAPETGEQYEAGVKFETIDKKLYFSAATYWIKRSNVLVASGLTLPVTGQAIFKLDGEQHSEGVELETQYLPLPNLQIQGGVALSKAFVAVSAKNPATVGDDLANAPRGSGNVWVRYNIPGGAFKGLGFGTGVIYVGKYWGGADTTAVYFSVPGYTRVDSAVYYKWKRYSFALNCANDFDRKAVLAVQAATAIFVSDERKLTLSASTKF